MTHSYRDRMQFWKQLPHPKPNWEDWKRILGHTGNDPDKAWAFWIKRMNKKQETDK